MDKNKTLLTLFSLVEALQVVVIAGLISSFIPIPMGEFERSLFPIAQARLKPEREILIYRLFILAGVLAQGFISWWAGKRANESTFWQGLKRWIIMDACLLAVEFFAAFKIFIYQDPLWARVLLYAAIALWGLGKIFWPEINRWISHREGQWMIVDKPRWAPAGIAASGLVLASLVVIADANQGLGLIYISDHFKTWTSPMGLNPGAWLRFLSIVVVIYATIFGWMIYHWKKNIFLAFFAMAMVIKLNLFHLGQFPLCWRDVSQTWLGAPFDLPFFFFLWRHIRSAKRSDLIVCAGLSIAASLFCFSSGICLIAALIVYQGLYEAFFNPEAKTSPWFWQGIIRSLVVMVGLTAVGWLIRGVRVDQWIGQWQLWHLGFDALPIYTPLRLRQFFPFVLGVVLPVGLTWTTVLVAQQIYIKQRPWEEIIVVVAAVYALALDHGFMYRSVSGGYYIAAPALVMMAVFWIDQVLNIVGSHHRRFISFIVAAVAWVALMTNNLMLIYPNIFNSYSPVLSAVKARYVQETGRE